MSAKNQLHKEYLKVAQNASGRSLNVPIYHYKGTQPGPTVYIQSSIHGAEVQGNVVIYHLIQAFKNREIKGEIILVPNCNPVGTNIKAGEYTMGRFDPVNGTNWNRGYYYSEQDVTAFVQTLSPSLSTHEIKTAFRAFLAEKIQARLNTEWGLGLAQQLNLKLQQMTVNADMVLDLHNGPVACRHIYVPEYALEAARHFNIPHTIAIPNTFAGALDEASFCPWWTLTDALKARDGVIHDFSVEAFTLEMGSQEIIDFDEGEYDANSILTYLYHQGAVGGTPLVPDTITRHMVYLANYKVLYSQQGGMVQYLVKPGEQVQKGQVMARVLNIDELDNQHGVEEIIAPCDLIVILHFPSASVLSGTQLYKCFVQSQCLYSATE